MATINSPTPAPQEAQVMLEEAQAQALAAVYRLLLHWLEKRKRNQPVELEPS